MKAKDGTTDEMRSFLENKIEIEMYPDLEPEYNDKHDNGAKEITQ
jgi:hypothetical protein